MTAELVVRVHHVPAPQGSFFARCVGKGRTHRAIVVADNKATEPWRKAVTEAAQNAMLATGWLPLNDALAVEIEFWMPRPATVKRQLPHVRPDIDKLARACLDALTAAEVFTDDALAVDLNVHKRYADGRPPGATIRISAMTEALL